MISNEEARQIKEQLFAQIEKVPEEQVQGLKEKIDSMTDEELEQFVKKGASSCVFCEIAKGNVKAFKIYEDKKFVAVLDIMPRSKGHTLIIPKKHIQNLSQLNEKESGEIFALAKKIISAIIQATGAEKVDIHAPTEHEQRVPHFALNLIPSYAKEKEQETREQEPGQEKEPEQEKQEKVSEQELQELSEKISGELNKILKGEQEKQKKEQEKKEEEEKEKKQEQEESEAQKLMKHIHERIP